MERLTMRDGFKYYAVDFEDDLDKAATMANKLKAYEDAEEEGRLVKLPCKIGDSIYWITTTCNYTFKNCPSPFRDCSICEEGKNTIIESKFDFNLLKMNKAELKDGFFLTREEAEAKLKEMENSDA